MALGFIGAMQDHVLKLLMFDLSLVTYGTTALPRAQPPEAGIISKDLSGLLYREVPEGTQDP